MSGRPAVEVAAEFSLPLGRAVVLGANGWFGRTAVELLEAMWGDEVAERAMLFARGPHAIATAAGRKLEARPLAEIKELEPLPGTLMIDCAYPTQEKVDELGADEYRRSVRELRQVVGAASEKLRPEALVSLSSGAALAGPEAPEHTRIYGEMKRRDEEELLALCPQIGARLCIARVYAASGPHMTKPETYALGDLIAQARAGGQMRVRAARPVYRSYSLASDILTLAIAAALEADPQTPVLFETGGEVIEVGELARRVALVVAGEVLLVERPEPDGSPEDRYIGDPEAMERIAADYDIELADLDEQIARTADGI